MAQVQDLSERIARVEENIKTLAKIEDHFTKQIDDLKQDFSDKFSSIDKSLDKIDKKLNNGISDEIKKNTQFRKIASWVVGVVGTVAITGFSIAIWKLLVNLEQLLKLIGK